MNAPLATAMAAAFREVMPMTPPAASANDRSLILSGYTGTPDALEAARIGDLKRVYELEIAWRNAWRVLPSVPAAEQQEQHDRGRELMAFSIERGAGPRGETLIEWSWIRPCPRCWRRLALRARCYKCNGEGHVSDEREIFYADLDGNVVEVQ